MLPQNQLNINTTVYITSENVGIIEKENSANGHVCLTLRLQFDHKKTRQET